MSVAATDQEGLTTFRSRVSHSMWADTMRRLLRNPQGAVAVGGLLIIVIAAVAAPLIAWHDPIDQDASARLLSPSWNHPFGTDELRRDLFSRNLHGLQTALTLSFLSVLTGAVLGTITGFTVGFVRGWADAVVMRLVDALLAFPGLLIAFAILTILGQGLENIGVAIVVFAIPGFTRLARAQMLGERNKDYVVAAQVVGASTPRVIFRHIVLNALPPLLTQVALAIASGVLIVAALGYFGLGEQAPTPSLGGLVNDSRPYLQRAWWYPVFPGAILAFLLLCLNLLADAINAAINPYARRNS
ncbi:MAG: ABC transporter permease [Dehalococcoidia bacterium]|nr:ABC transporter permease [Dehalococcoidia bacterium]MYA54511.1 ABC transporter permease [Dehalococcoidia bacterium]